MVAELSQHAEARLRSVGGHTEIPNAVLDDPALDAYELSLYAQIRRRDWHGGGWVWTYAELCAAARMGRDTLARSLRTLDERGLIRREGPAKRPKRYFALVPAGPPGLPADRHRMTARSSSDDGQIVIEKRQDRHSMTAPSSFDDGAIVIRTSGPYNTPSQTIKDDDSGVCRDLPSAPAPAPAREALHTQPGPSLCDHAVDTITGAIIVARESTVAVERSAGRLAGLQASVRQHIVAPLAGDPRQITPGQVVRCVAYLRSKGHITPRMVTARTVADELGEWLAAGAPDRYEAPVRSPAREAPRRADLPAPLYGDGPHDATICLCGRIEGRPHRRNICRMPGLVAPNNYRDMHHPDWITTPEGAFEEYDDEPGDSPGGQAAGR